VKIDYATIKLWAAEAGKEARKRGEKVTIENYLAMSEGTRLWPFQAVEAN
jgi:hypothetical protein